ncbi:MAG: hypothetical protein JJLCMIEE_03039 [Acidimicrobiales bacterium]|nr:MAG: hypothetical protein EDR02_07820 [Actinomycetota bacterium]MBV6509923.1 hypothetical protein [Acidimicrobiales bacterium]RIK08585.1 MAG: hypothetical protein DCC48_01185 [Acidobacteriota bacterium]
MKLPSVLVCCTDAGIGGGTGGGRLYLAGWLVAVVGLAGCSDRVPDQQEWGAALGRGGELSAAEAACVYDRLEGDPPALAAGMGLAGQEGYEGDTSDEAAVERFVSAELTCVGESLEPTLGDLEAD